jgi:acyl carrier protein phosphodiesterase
MNYLAHIYLSGEDNDIKIGNFIADGIHGKPDTYTPGVQHGIILHRAIDTFTDAHPIFRQGTKRLHARYHHYAGVIMDIFYDHFLAKNWHLYHPQPLGEFANDFYNLANQRLDTLPQRIQGMLPYMVQYNWLLRYASKEGIARTLFELDHRTKNISGMTNAVDELEAFYAEFEQEFTAFFKEMQAFVKQKLNEL